MIGVLVGDAIGTFPIEDEQSTLPSRQQEFAHKGLFSQHRMVTLSAAQNGSPARLVSLVHSLC